MRRVLDILISVVGLILLSPFIIYTSLRIKADDAGNIFFKQKRVGKNGKEFYLYKFRTMYANSEHKGMLTYGNDSRVTKYGQYLRKYKLDEIPQLLNVLTGDMSIVGPRPEVKKYVDLYTEEQREVLRVRPGITDMASITYYNEAEILSAQSVPEQYYIAHIMPEKIKLNKAFIDRPTVTKYFSVIYHTIKKIATQ